MTTPLTYADIKIGDVLLVAGTSVHAQAVGEVIEVKPLRTWGIRLRVFPPRSRYHSLTLSPGECRRAVPDYITEEIAR